MADRGRRRWQGPKSGPCFCLLTSNRPFRLPSINLVARAAGFAFAILVAIRLAFR
jgi:hypothetical protein